MRPQNRLVQIEAFCIGKAHHKGAVLLKMNGLSGPTRAPSDCYPHQDVYIAYLFRLYIGSVDAGIIVPNVPLID